MSIAKTPDQKEANLASIRIIKARFAQDGQTFTDCIFNNDTMQIIIEDKRYPVKTTLRKQTEDDVNRINDTAEIVKRSSDINIHAQINMIQNNQKLDPEERRIRVNQLEQNLDKVARQGYKIADSLGLNR